MNISSLLLSIIFHTGIFLSILIFFNSELRQKTKIHHDLVPLHIIKNKHSSMKVEHAHAAIVFYYNSIIIRLRFILF